MTGATREALDGNGIGTDTVTKSGRAAAHRPTTSGRILKTSTNLGGKAGVTVQPLLEAGADSGSKQVDASVCFVMARLRNENALDLPSPPPPLLLALLILHMSVFHSIFDLSIKFKSLSV